MARKKRSAKRVVVVARTTHKRKRRVSGTSSVGRTHHHKPRKRRVSGAVGKTHKRKRRSVGSTMSMSTAKEIVKMAIGATAGVAANNLIILPAERMLTEKFPMAGKLMGAAQAILGGVITLKAKGNMGKAFGLTILAGGAQTLVRQFKLNEHIPGISGANDDYTTLQIPMAGNSELTSMVAGLLDSNETPNMPYVASSHRRHRGHHHMNLHNTTSGGDHTTHYNDARLSSYVGDSEYDILPAKNYSS